MGLKQVVNEGAPSQRGLSGFWSTIRDVMLGIPSTASPTVIGRQSALVNRVGRQGTRTWHRTTDFGCFIATSSYKEALCRRARFA
jgi:hypothetical protein